jgi:hypothetical protein
MQAQLPPNPYVGLWSRLEGFSPDDLSQLLLDRKVVRIVVMRGTIHLVTAEDCLVLRPLVQPVLDRELGQSRDVAPGLRGVDLGPVLAFARPLLEQRPLNGAELRAALAAQFPHLDATALAYACRNRLALVQVTPRGVWGTSAQVRSTTAEAWLGRPLATNPSLDEVVLRYLGAFGPATVADIAAWSGLTGLREVVERLRPRLQPFRDERGRELVDLPDAPRPDADTPAPPRFLPEYDNVWLSFADRSRFLPEPHRTALYAGDRPVKGSVLHDGMIVATWWVDHDGDAGTAALEVDHVAKLTKQAGAAIAREGRGLLRLLHPGHEHDVRFVAVG